MWSLCCSREFPFGLSNDFSINMSYLSEDYLDTGISEASIEIRMSNDIEIK